MKKIITLVIILALLPVSGITLKAARVDSKDSPGSFEKEPGSTVKKKSNTFGKIVIWTLAAAAVGAVVYFTVIKKPEYKLKVEVGSGVEGSPATGEYKYKKGSTVGYDFRKLAGYGSLTVTLDGSKVTASGTITMDKEHSLSATALEIGNYTSIKFKCRFYLKSYNVFTLSKTATLKDDFNPFLQRIGIIGPIESTWNCPSFIDTGITCDNAPIIEDVSVEQETNKNHVIVYQNYSFRRCNRDYPPVLCNYFEFTVLSYTWEQGKADPGSPQIKNLDDLKIEPARDFIEYNNISFGFTIEKRLTFVRPSNPQAAQRVFTVGCL